MSLENLKAVIGDLPIVEQPLFNVEKVRNVGDIVGRAIALYITATYADILLQKNCSRDEAFAFANKFITRYDANELFSPAEKQFMEATNPSDELIGKFCWGWEPLNFLLWVLNYIPSIGLPTAACSVAVCGRSFSRNRFRKNILENAKIRDQGELQQKLEILNLCLVARDKSKFESGVLDGWRKSALWITSPEQEWDTINA